MDLRGQPQSTLRAADTVEREIGGGMDTVTPMTATYARMVAGMSMSERFVHALALSAFVRALAWQGAVLHAVSQDADAVVDRFVLQLYGAEVAAWFRAVRLRRER